MSFLDTILETKRVEIALLKAEGVMAPVHGEGAHRSLRSALLQRSTLGVIAEIKRKSPSKGVIQSSVDPVERAKTYAAAGATAISVLTDKVHFQGSIEDLIAVRQVVDIPVLRKDFIIDELQIDEAVAAGADAILLIAAALSPQRLRELSSYAQNLGLDVLLEVHDVDELDAALAAKPSVLGVNNRNLHTFEVDLATTERVIAALPHDTLAISESGIFGTADARRMALTGARAVLVGELLMRHAKLADVANEVAALQVELPLPESR
ncbi:indole-3-glycerol phosphate synthase TrpC [Alicyclobacillus fodiniaquatilis]|jgi:indole-3-glycerol phosphate synthase|uniref:Indole-3-glycerol phosphate synthase n=1 Tax=Alicyclobacillus fodiniaquatilis TaxID=1661150 RepID=A0ABW4JLA0_9BACL